MRERRAILWTFCAAPVLAVAACNALIGIDDLPPVANDGAAAADGSSGGNDAATGPNVDGATNDATLGGDDANGDDAADAGPFCGIQTGDAASDAGDVADCGPCHVACPIVASRLVPTCVDGVCGYAGPATEIPGFLAIDAGAQVNEPLTQMAMDDQQRVFLGALEQLDAATPRYNTYWVSFDGGVETVANSVHGYMSVMLGKDAVDTGPNSGIVGTTRDGVELFDFDTKGKNAIACVTTTVGFSASIEGSLGTVLTLDPSSGMLNGGTARSSTCTVSMAPGGSSSTLVNQQTPLYISQTGVGFSVRALTVTDWDLRDGGPPTSTSLPFLTTSAQPVIEGAVGTDGWFLFTATNRDDVRSVYSKAPGASASQLTTVTADVPGDPVVTAANVAIISDTTEQTLTAVDVETAALSWTLSLPAAPSAVLVGDNGLIWAAVGVLGDNSAGEIYGIDEATGNVRFHFTGIDRVGDLLLERGRLIAQSDRTGNVVLIPVPSQGYEPGSSWPVRGHDNQRTYNASSPLTY